MKIFITILALFLCVTVMAQTEQVRVVGDFSGISSASGINVQITQGNENKVTVSSSDASFLDKLKTEVDKNGLLKIYMEYKNGMGWENKKGVKLNAFVTYKILNKIAASSGSSLNTTNILKTNTLSIDVSSGAALNADIQADDCNIDVSSGANSTIMGTANDVKIDVSSGSVFEGTQLATQQCKASASSGASIKIAVAKQLNASASSGGSVLYKGNPDVQKNNVSSGGEVRKMK